MALKLLKKLLPLTASMTLLFGLTGLMVAFPVRLLISEFNVPWWAFLAPCIIFFALVMNFVTAAVLDPGRYPKCVWPEDGQEDSNAPQFKRTIICGEFEVQMKWCPTCKFYRPPRVTHCSQCDACTERFDHHCPWVNNCVGRRNYKFFFAFLVLLCIHMLDAFIIAISFVMRHPVKNDHNFIITGIVLSFIGLLILPVYALTAFHIFLVITGRTTNEQVSGKVKNGNPFDEGCSKNCANILCDPITPNYLLKLEPKNSVEVMYTKRKRLGTQITTNGNGIMSKSPFSPTQPVRATSNVPKVVIRPADVVVDVSQQHLNPDRFRAKVTPIERRVDEYTVEVHEDGSSKLHRNGSLTHAGDYLLEPLVEDDCTGMLDGSFSHPKMTDSMMNLMEEDDCQSNQSDEVPVEEVTKNKANMNNSNHASSRNDSAFYLETLTNDESHKKLSVEEVTENQKLQLDSIMKDVDAQVALLQDECVRLEEQCEQRSNSTSDHTQMLPNGRSKLPRVSRSRSQEYYAPSRFEKLPKAGHVSSLVGRFESTSSEKSNDSSRPTSAVSNYSSRSSQSSTNKDTVALLDE